MGAIFKAKVANLIGWGEIMSKGRNGNWRDKFRWELEGHVVTIKQHRKVLTPKPNELRGKWVGSSTLTITKISSVEEGIIFAEDLCWLLTFATQSSVRAYDFKFAR